MAKKYPHVTSHLETLRPESVGMESTTGGDFNRGSASLRTAKDLNRYRDYNLDQALVDTKLKFPGMADTADSDPTHVPFNHDKEFWAERIQASKDMLGQWAKDYMPNPRYRIRTNPKNTSGLSAPKTLRHEYGHAVTALKDEPSALVYRDNSDKYGYWANPDEVRARAIAAKNPRSGGGGSTYSKNDYMNRIMSQMTTARENSTPEQKKAVLDAIESMQYEMPNAFYDRLTKPGSDNWQYLKYNWSK